MSFPEIEDILIGILIPLIDLHQNLIIHRDLKPDNILIVDGIIKLSDFGIAKPEYCERSIRNNNFNPLRTTAYIAPEVIEAYLENTALPINN